MEAVRMQQTIQKRGELTIRNLPVEKGQQVEVLLLFTPSETSKRPRLTARQLLHSGLIGLWKERQDIADSASYARQYDRFAPPVCPGGELVGLIGGRRDTLAWFCDDGIIAGCSNKTEQAKVEQFLTGFEIVWPLPETSDSFSYSSCEKTTTV